MTKTIRAVHMYEMERPQKEGKYIISVRYHNFTKVETTAEWHGAWTNIDIPSNDYDEVIWWSDPETDIYHYEEDDEPQMPVRPMSPSEFAERMKEISETDTGYGGCDTEDNHRAMDGLMCDVLRSLGYGEGVDIFDDTEKWYS